MIQYTETRKHPPLHHIHELQWILQNRGYVNILEFGLYNIQRTECV